MEVSRTKCFFISVDYFDMKTCGRRIRYAKDVIMKKYPRLNNSGWKLKAIKDNKGKYLGTRVWRLA